MERYAFYVDGFNMYYAMQGGFRGYKWLNYRKLCEDIAGPANRVGVVKYFSAFVTWKPDSYRRHQTYIKALRAVGVEFIKGRFLEKDVRCHMCQRWFKTREEKQTDVNIAIELLSDAINDAYDRAVIVSADSDLIPAMKAVRNHFPAKQIGVMFPVGRSSFELRNEADFIKKMRQRHLASCQFPDEYTVGKEVLRRPGSWR